MSNPVDYALTLIKYNIPIEILRYAFPDYNYSVHKTSSYSSLFERIKLNVIDARVKVDLNIIGGKEILVNIQDSPKEILDDGGVIIEIPLTKTNNRPIISIVSINYLPALTNLGGYGTANGIISHTGSYSDFESVGHLMADSYSSIPNISTATAELIGANTILIRDKFRTTYFYELRCRIANSENLRELQPSSYRAFAKACMLAVKSYIYNQQIIKMDQGQLEQGQNVGEIKNTIDQYSNAEQEYVEHIDTVMGKIMYMNDIERHRRFIKLQLTTRV